MTGAPPRPALRRTRRAAKRALVRVLGRPLLCATCGRPLFIGLPIPWRGGVKIMRLSEEVDVHVSFRASDTIELRHMELDQCPSPERPWVP